jgi:hypothetical protein
LWFVNDGGVISAGYGKLEHVGEAFHAEIIACLSAIQKSGWFGGSECDPRNRCIHGGASSEV